MEAVDIDGIKVLFPYKPYDLQLDYMKSIIKCLQQKSNGLLESPTGTGKTLCILCSVLGWLDHKNVDSIKQLLDKNGINSEKLRSVPKTLNGFQLSESLPQILYSSRTHSQLSQACHELKRTSYTSYKAVVIGSRDQLCVNADVNKLETISAKNQMCRQKVNTNSCAYYRNYEQKVDRNEDYNSTNVFDIEDLVRLGRKNTCCPYYASRHIRQKSNLIFTPYNYILDPSIRSSNSLDLKNSVVIFDEGHNIEKMCEESVSLELRSDTFAICIKHIDFVLQTLKEIKDGTYAGLDAKEYSELNIVIIAKLKLMVCDLEMAIDSMIKKNTSMKSLHETKSIFEIMDKIGFEVNSCMQWCDIMERISMILTNSSTLNANQATLTSTAFTSLSQFVEKLIPIKLTTSEEYKSHKNEFIKKFKIFSERGNESEDEKKSFWNRKSDPDSWILYIWCLSPSFGAKALLDLNIHCMIITSGTLAPINSFEIEMEINFPIKLQNSHIIKENQLSIMNISNSRDKTILTSKYDNRDNLQYYRALGQTLIELLTAIPKGVLIFFSSYTALNKCIQIWKESNENIWTKLNAVKQIFLEPRNKQTFSECIIKYKLKIDENDSKGAVFFGVCRGKLSEGIDLPDDYCRSVIMTGLPFPSIADPRVILKKQYLNEAKTKLSADGWYALQMKRALNQSIGRVVRHKDDFGVIILLDSRFASLNDGLSKWVEKFIYRNRINNLDESIKKLQTFFSMNKNFIKKSTSVTNNTFNESTPSVKSSGYSNSFYTGLKISKKSDTSVNSNQKSVTNGFIDEKTIFNEYKSSNCSSIPKSKSIFDSISSTITTSKENNSESNSANNFSNNHLNESPLKKPKLNVPLKTICITPSIDAKPETPNTKIQSIIKTKSNTESNSSKKVRWNVNKNRVHTFKPTAIDFNNESDTNFDQKDKTDSKEIQNSDKSAKKSNEDLLDFWRKFGAQLKELFKGSNKFNQLCQTIKTYKKYKNLRLLSMSFKGIFEKCDPQTRQHFITELSIIVPKSETHIFLSLCDIEPTAHNLSNKEFITVKRGDKLFPKTHFCMICKSNKAVSPHRTLCCASVACYQCFKKWRKSYSSNCFNCNHWLKLSDLKHLYFDSSIV